MYRNSLILFTCTLLCLLAKIINISNLTLDVDMAHKRDQKNLRFALSSYIICINQNTSVVFPFLFCGAYNPLWVLALVFSPSSYFVCVSYSFQPFLGLFLALFSCGTHENIILTTILSTIIFTSSAYVLPCSIKNTVLNNVVN